MLGRNSGKATRIIGIITLAAMLTLSASTQAYARARLTFGTGNAGGVFFILGAAMASVISEQSEIMEVTAQATTGTTENLAFTQTRDLTFSFTIFDAAHVAYHGVREYEHVGRLPDLRVVLFGHVGYNTMLVFDHSPIRSIADLNESHSVSVAPGMINLVTLQAAFYGHGRPMHPNPVALSFTEMATALRDGTIDVMTFHGAHPASSVLDVASAGPIRLLGHTPETMDRILTSHPYYVRALLPAGTYDWQTEDFLTIGTPYAIITHRDTPDEYVQEFLRIIFDTDWTEFHPSGSYFIPENTFYRDLYRTDGMIPFHPAAAVFLEENFGITGLPAY